MRGRGRDGRSVGRLVGRSVGWSNGHPNSNSKMVGVYLTEDGWCHPNCRRILANSFLSSLTAACKRLPDLLTSFDQDAFVVFT